MSFNIACNFPISLKGSIHISRKPVLPRIPSLIDVKFSGGILGIDSFLATNSQEKEESSVAQCSTWCYKKKMLRVWSMLETYSLVI